MTREEAIKILEEEAEFLYGGDEPYNKIAFDMAIEALKDRPQGDWIPCSERLPSEKGWYLITVQGMNRFADMVYYYGNSEWAEISSKQKVIAWMPLPKPYREDGE